MITRLIFAAILLAFQGFLFRRYWKWSAPPNGLPHRTRMPVVALFIIFNAALVAVAFLRIRNLHFPEWFLLGGVYPFLVWHSATFLLGFTLFLAQLAQLPFKGAWAGLKKIRATAPHVQAISAHPGVQRFDASRRTFLRRGVYGLTAASFAGTTYGMFVERGECDITEAILRVPGLPGEFSGYSIGLVTDVHSSIYMGEAEMASYVRLLNGMGADMILVGGDIVNGQGDEIEPFAEAFSGLRAPDGVFGVLGNHDFYSREPDRITETATAAGVRILRDASQTITRGGAALRLYGIDDVGNPAAATARIQKVLAADNASAAGPRILLCHRPYFLPQASAAGMDVMLSGHTHGGQVVFGRLGETAFTPAALASPYLAGVYREGPTQMYVSRGIGTVGIPVRINCPPELTRIVLKPA